MEPAVFDNLVSEGVTESKFILLAAKQVNKSRDELLRQGIVALFGKPADQEDGGLVFQRTALPKLELRLVLHQKGSGVGCCKLLRVKSLCSCICPCRTGHDAPVTLQGDKCYSLFCNFLSLYDWESVIPLKVRALRIGYPVYFRL